MQLLDFLDVYLPAVVFGIIALASPLFYLKLNRKGYLFINGGFALLAVG